jgi:hypothetical protein
MTNVVALIVLLLLAVAAIALARAPRLAAVLAFLSAASCLIPFVWLIAWPGVAIFGSATVYHWSRGRYARTDDHSVALR